PLMTACRASPGWGSTPTTSLASLSMAARRALARKVVGAGVSSASVGAASRGRGRARALKSTRSGVNRLAISGASVAALAAAPGLAGAALGTSTAGLGPDIGAEVERRIGFLLGHLGYSQGEKCSSLFILRLQGIAREGPELVRQ